MQLYEKTNKAFAEHLSMKEAVEQARSLSIELAIKVAVAYNSEKYQESITPISKNEMAIVEIDECDYGQPWIWKELVFKNGTRLGVIIFETHL